MHGTTMEITVQTPFSTSEVTTTSLCVCTNAHKPIIRRALQLNQTKLTFIPNLQLFLRNYSTIEGNREVWCCGKDPDLYSGCCRRLCLLRFIVLFFSPFSQVMRQYLEQITITSFAVYSCFSFTCQSAIRLKQRSKINHKKEEELQF